MKILITGATGFLGSHLTKHLAQMGHQIFALVRNEEKFQKLNLPATPIVGELRFDGPHHWIKKLPHDLDAVIHNAGIVHSFNPKKFYDINSRATKQLIEDLAIMYPQQLRFTLISSLAASGASSKGRPRTEEDEPKPISHYGHSKHLAEIYLGERAPATWKKIIIRPPVIIGPGDEAFVDVFTMVKKGFVVVPGLQGDEKEYSFVCVYDLIDAIAKTFKLNLKKTTPEIFFIGHPKPFTYGELLEKITELVNPPKRFNLRVPFILIFIAACLNRLLHSFFPQFDFRLTPDKAMEIKEDYWVCSATHADELMSLNYQWTFEQTLKTTHEDYKNQNKL